MNLDKIETELKNLSVNPNKETFIYEFLLAFGLPKSSINRLKKGDYNQSKNDGEIIWAKKIYFRAIFENEDVHDVIDEISKNNVIEKQKIRFVIVTDFKTFLSKDIKAEDTLDINFSKLVESLNFFLPLIGQEKIISEKENQADVKAAYQMSKFYDILVSNNEEFLKNDKDKHGLNIFFSRILFCFFAEDSNIYEKGLFTNSISSYTKENGDDLTLFITKLFEILNTEEKKRESYPNYLKKFPYVNGGLFKNSYKVPYLDSQCRKILIECGSLDWKSINPDIFGSMIQSISNHGQRKDLGMHYTSVQNILKLIKPLFLDDLYHQLNEIGRDKKKLNKLLKRIYNIKVFDPACGSGNFLVVSYKELYKLEIEILKILKESDENEWLLVKSGIRLNNFYGIEIDDYAHEIAKLSLWIAEHQMNVIYENILNETRPTLPLSSPGNIVCSDAIRLNWLDFCKNENENEIFIVGNPPYLGSKLQNKHHKEDLSIIFGNFRGIKLLDYISCWFMKGSEFIKKTNSKLAFVSTNSLCQGEQVSILWPLILKDEIEIFFAYNSFSWSNHAKNKAGVSVVIIGICKNFKKEKFIFLNNKKIIKAKNINPYLVDSENIFIYPENKSISGLPHMSFGNMSLDKGHLHLSLEEKNNLENNYPNSKKFIKVIMGGDEYVNGHKKYCLWIKDQDIYEANNIPLIRDKILRVKDFRENSKDLGTKKLSKFSHKFRDTNETITNSIIIPRYGTQKRKYLPIGFIDNSILASDSSLVVYEAPLYIFSILSSRLHMIWVNAVGGAIGTNPRYSIKICYNTFPLPKIDKNQIDILEKISLKLLDEREKFSDKTLGYLYDPDKMPNSILSIHNEIDLNIEKFYDIKSDISDENKLKHLFQKYIELKKEGSLIK